MENNFKKVLALLDTGIPAGGSFLESLSSPLLIVAISIGLVIIAGLFYFLLSRGESRSSVAGKSHRLTKSNDSEEDNSKKRKRHKRRRRDHRKRNPTLSEAGGFPPALKGIDQTSKKQNRD